MKEGLPSIGAALGGLLALPFCWLATPILTAVGLGGVGLFGLLGGHRWIFLPAACAILALSFYQNVTKRRSRLNAAVFAASAALVVGSAAYGIL